jgi:hypothetical protein
MQISVLQMEVQLVLELCLKFLKSFISGTCAHGRAVDFFVHSIRNPDAFPAVECLTVNQALNGACTGTGTAFMGDAIRFE